MKSHLLKLGVHVCAGLQVLLGGKTEVPLVQGETEAKVDGVSARLLHASEVCLLWGRVIYNMPKYI